MYRTLPDVYRALPDVGTLHSQLLATTQSHRDMLNTVSCSAIYAEPPTRERHKLTLNCVGRASYGPISEHCTGRLQDIDIDLLLDNGDRAHMTHMAHHMTCYS